jgi:hypothetical protein
MRPSENFAKFQRAVTLGESTDDLSLEAALKENPSDYKYLHTFHQGLRSNSIDPDTLLINASVMAVRGDKDLLPYVGQALQAGANPNMYAETRNPGMSDESGREPDVIFTHILVSIWSWIATDMEQAKENAYLQGSITSDELDDDSAVELMEESQRLGIMVTAMLILAGADLDMRATTPQMLLSSNINPTRSMLEFPFYNLPVRSYLSRRETKGTELWMMHRERLQLYSEKREDMRDVFQSALSSDRSRDSIFTLCLYLDHAPVLTLFEVYTAEESMGLMFQYQAVNSLLQLAARWTRNGEILTPSEESSPYAMSGPAPEFEQTNRIRESDLLYLSLRFFNISMIDYLLSSGIQRTFWPSNFQTRVLADSRFFQYDYPTQSKILNTMIIKMAEYGAGLDNRQYALLGYSPLTKEGVDKSFKTPIWINACQTIQGDKPLSMNPDILEIARQLDFDLGMAPTEICRRFEELYSVDEKSLARQLLTRQQKLIDVRLSEPVTTIENIIPDIDARKLRERLGQDNTLSMDEIQQMVNAQQAGKMEDPSIFTDENKDGKSYFANSEILTQNVYDYPEIDRVIYKSNGRYWIFTSDNYSDLISSKINPWSQSNPDQFGDPIPDQVILEMERKLELITFYGLNEKPGSISRGVRMLYAGSVTRSLTYHQRDATRRLELFLSAMESNGIEREYFENLTSDDILNMSTRVLSDSSQIITYKEDPTLALWDFSDAFLLDVNTFQSFESALEKIKE